MKDPEFIELRNKFLTGLVVAIVFAIPIMIFVVKSFNTNTSEVLTNIKEKKDMVILITDNSCDSCSGVEEILKENKVFYLSFNISQENDYDEIRKRLNLSEEFIEVPGIVKVEEGVMVANLMNIKDRKLLNEFLVYHQLVNTLDK